MSELAIRVEGLGKLYRIGQRQSHRHLREALAATAAAPFRALRARLSGAPRNGNSRGETFWALRNVSFDIRDGEIVGIIGRNGAGKSTLLKILSRITEPTEGRAVIHGRVGSLLEVGTGFHSELTGRENVFLNGAILGMSKAEIARKFDEIVAFSEVEKFIDTPVKHYSSGMYVRLAFAVAAHLETEVLFVDEVLSVGDAEFQKKCLNKMQGAGEEGRTVFLVSHNMTAIQRLCQKAFWLEHGNIALSGSVREVVSAYLSAESTAMTQQEWPNPDSAPGNEKVRLRSIRIRPVMQPTKTTDEITVRTPFVMEFEYWNLKPEARLNLSLLLYTEDGTIAFATGPGREPVWHGKPFPAGLFRSVCYVPGDLLNDGTHRLVLLVVENRSVVIYRHEDVLTFEVKEDISIRDGWYGDWPGATRPMLRWTTELVSPIAAVQQR
jgi:lipopolysaccharide transport system ATP-binding protein